MIKRTDVKQSSFYSLCPCEGDNLSVAKPGFPPRAPPIWADAFYLAVNKKIWFCQISNKSYKFCFSL